MIIGCRIEKKKQEKSVSVAKKFCLLKIIIMERLLTHHSITYGFQATFKVTCKRIRLNKS